jgi:hypothetical protein
MREGPDPNKGQPLYLLPKNLIVRVIFHQLTSTTRIGKNTYASKDKRKIPGDVRIYMITFVSHLNNHRLFYLYKNMWSKTFKCINNIWNLLKMAE